MAALLRRGPLRWRSTQLTLALICPPANHWACGSFQTRALSHFFNQASASACSAQTAAGSSLARCQSFSYSARLLTCALAANSAGGGKVRVSCRTLVMLAEAGEDIRGSPCRPGRRPGQRARSGEVKAGRRLL